MLRKFFKLPKQIYKKAFAYSLFEKFQQNDHPSVKLIEITGKLNHEAVEIPDYKLSTIARMSDMDHLRRTLDKILVPRVVGTPGHDNVRDFIIKSMKELSWTIEVDDFMDNAPSMGDMKFENIIATLNPKAERYLILACHYDSKYFKNEEFLGATDSAVPCAMLINIAYVMREELQKASKNNDLSLKFLFFDGEEAFVEWGPKDSIYGARHLAEKWEESGFLPRIDMLLLLDLLGSPDPNFYNFFKDTEKWYAQLIGIEERLATGTYLSSYTTNGVSKIMPNRYFQPHTAHSYVEDDHIPFLQRGVPILHLIPIPFPSVWHTKDDNYEAIDFETIENLNRILRVFVAEYLQMQM